MKTKAIAAAALLVATGSALASPNHQQYSFSFIGNETNVLNLVGIFGLVGIRGCVTVDNTGNAVVQSNQSVDVHGVNLKGPLLGTYTTGKVTYGVDSKTTTVSNQGSAYLIGGSTTTSYNNTTSWVNAEANGHLNTSQSFQAGAGYVAGQSSSGSGGFIAGGGYQYSNIAAAGGIIGGGIIPLPGGLALYGGYIVGNAGAGQGSVWGGYAYGQQSQSAGGFLAGGFLNTQKSFDAAFHGVFNEGQASISSESIAAGALWGFSDTYMKSTTWEKGALTLHVNTSTLQTMGATLGSGALANANGNIGVNVAAGADNAQANNVAIASLNAQPVYASAQVFANQSSKGSASISQFYVNSSVGDGALAGATGNVGVNVASGVGNVQQNGLAAAVSQGGTGWFKGGAANSTAQTDQTASMKASGDFIANASLGNGALAWASGNVGVNVASGIGNVQANSLAISAIK
ncbi:hypothetical protein [Pandoraea apista]|uniref:Uncharacterized protein n=1 Tax=Pandoraea apista TaxID=93218 RepID=A0ABX9ZWP1_9BURK|nr:hypothetical protein [Pandoraea apista]AVF40476.1 hypothetical protein AL486_12725 [Pandoraea apista]PTE03021.1 hypothetical protein C7830_02105 [Pandoraea apista]RRJ35173.1 hypothetical protein EIB05_00570 [Pandoraea apista]RRJ81586.1 hypothetical protein EIL82_02710 [Pandoraea apista]RSD10087.1 hypothetical protein EJB12_14370 [Pandoraea apista]